VACKQARLLLGANEHVCCGQGVFQYCLMVCGRSSNATVDAVYVALRCVLTISSRTIKDEAQVGSKFCTVFREHSVDHRGAFQHR
jgi:hypothetical protein